MGSKNKGKIITSYKPCMHYKKCGGCQLQRFPYDVQLSRKQVNVIRLLGRFHHVSEIIGMDDPYHYRNKVQAAFGKDRNGRTVSGIYQSSTHNIVPVDSCLIEDKKADEIIVTIRKLLKSFKLQPYDENTGRGFLRHVLVKRGFKSGEIMVVLVSGSDVFPKKRSFINALLKHHPEITTVVFNVNKRYTSMVLGSREEVVYGSGKITDELCGFKFRISPKAFYQINPVQTEVLYSKAIEFADLRGNETVIDAYCGIGTIGIAASRQAGKVIGVELNEDAVRDAKENAALNGVKNIEFYCADAGEFMRGMAEDGGSADTVIMDPPRAGSDKKFLSSVLRLAPKKIVYISCNPETLRRDLFYLTRDKKYRVRRIQPVDMFPFTEHVECVVSMFRTGK